MHSLPPAPWGKPWFHSKPGGYGSSLPCSWEGWATYGLFLILVLAWSIGSQSNGLLPGGINKPLGIGGVVVLIIGFGVVVRNRTVGGWRAGTDGE
jgi:hypothetical protein